jgi:2-phospho-L-lactate guanylyltransferase
MRGALIPMKPLAEAKMRLADVLDQRERAELALAMLVDVVTACADSEMFDTIGVVSSDSEVFWQVRELGAMPIAEPATLSGLNDGLTFGVRYLARRVGCDEVVIFPADVPLVRPVDVCTVVNALAGGALAGAEKRVVLVRAADNGTNALGLRPPEVISMRFGIDSASAHRREAEAAGADVVELELDRLAFDVDAAGDVATLASRAVGAATRGWIDARASYGSAIAPVGDA